MQLKYPFVVNMLHSLHQQSSDFYLNKYLMSTYYVPVMLSTENLREDYVKCGSSWLQFQHPGTSDRRMRSLRIASTTIVSLRLAWAT